MATQNLCVTEIPLKIAKTSLPFQAMSRRKHRKRSDQSAKPRGNGKRTGQTAASRLSAVIITVATVGIVLAAIATWVYRPSRPEQPALAATGEQSGPQLVSNAPTNEMPRAVSQAASQPPGEHNHADEGSSMSEAEKAVGLLTLGNEVLAEGKIDEAIGHYRHALAHDPGSEDTHYNLAIALAQAGRIEESIEHYQEALRILPDYAEAHNNLGNLLSKQGKLDDAIKHFEQALEVNPDSASAHNNLGTALAKRGKITDATVHFAQAVYLMPEYSDARYNLATAYITQGRIGEAATELKELLQRDPQFEPAVRALAKLESASK